MALKGIKVIEFAGLAPAPFCGKILRDLGARVIRIDKYGTKFTPDRLSHDKESISINMKNERGLNLVKDLTKNADVLIEPFRKGVMERLGLGPSVIHSINPRLIYARLTGYGQFGELSDKAGHDINFISYSGILSCLGREGEKPYAPINLLADFAGGGLMCAFAIMTALYERSINPNKTNKVIDCSMVEGAAYVGSWLWASRDIPGVWGGNARGTNLLDGGYAPYETYETKDGKYMASGGLEPQFYENLLKGLGLSSTEEITKELIEREFKKKTQDEWVEIFKDLDACVSPILKLDEAPLLKHNQERKSFVNQNQLPTMNWIELNENERKFKMPKVGEHSKNILNEIGLSDSDIDQLVKDNIIETYQPKSKL